MAHLYRFDDETRYNDRLKADFERQWPNVHRDHYYFGYCPECGNPYTSNRSHKETCSPACRQRRSRRLKHPYTKINPF